METAETLTNEFRTRAVCVALSVSRSSLLRRRHGPVFDSLESARVRHVPRQLSDQERAGVLSTLHSTRFVDMSVPQVHAQLLGEKIYLCSV